MCTTGDDSDRRSELRVGEQVVSVLTFFTLERLFHGLRIYNCFDPVCGLLFGDELEDYFCILRSSSVEM